MRWQWPTAILATLVGLGCPTPTPTPSKAATAATPSARGDEPVAADPAPEPEPDPVAPKADVPAAAPPPSPMGQVLADAPIPLERFIGASPTEAETMLGEPQAKGGTRKSCVRFVPDKVWFHCEQAWQRYADSTGTAESIHVTYEEGKVASVAFEKLLGGEGAFDPNVALAKVGLKLVEEPTLQAPAENVRLWSWWNAQSKLLLRGRQYRVEVSSVEDKWETSKVDIILNDPLNDDERSRTFEVKPQRGAGTGED